MIDQKQIINDKPSFLLPRVAVFVGILFFGYVDFSFVFSLKQNQALEIISLLDILLFTGTLLPGMCLLTTKYYYVYILNSSSQTLSILEKALFSDKYRIVKCLPFSYIGNVVIDEKHISYSNVCFDLMVKDSDGNTVYSKLYDIYKKQIANNTAEDIRKVLNGEIENYQLVGSDLVIYENVFIGFIIAQLVVNLNYIKHLLFGAFM